MACIHYGHCRRDPDTGEVLCHQCGGWRDSCPMDGADDDEDGILVNANNTNNNNYNNKEDEDEE